MKVKPMKAQKNSFHKTEDSTQERDKEISRHCSEKAVVMVYKEQAVRLR